MNAGTVNCFSHSICTILTLTQWLSMKIAKRLIFLVKFIIVSGYFLVFAGEVLGALCKKVGPETYGDVKDQILQSIRSNLEREMPSGEEDDGRDDVEKLVQKLSSSPGGEKVHCNSSTGQ